MFQIRSRLKRYRRRSKFQPRNFLNREGKLIDFQRYRLQTRAK